MDLIFCGTPQFAVPTLEKLVAERFTVKLVLSNPDEARGRGHKVQPPPVKALAQKHGLEVYQPASLRNPETQSILAQRHPDAIVVVAYGRILPAWMIDLPLLGCINLHASLLPKYRGAAPINWALIEGEKEAGVTTMKIDAGMDTGDTLLARRETIRDDDTAESLGLRLSRIGAGLMVETLRKLERGEITPRPQDSRLATYAPKLKKQDGRIDWSQPADVLARRVRGLIPWPGAHTTFRGRNLHIWRAESIPDKAGLSHVPGTLVIEGGKLAVSCGGDTLLILHEVQLEGRKRLSALEFVNGARLISGETFHS